MYVMNPSSAAVAVNVSVPMNAVFFQLRRVPLMTIGDPLGGTPASGCATGATGTPASGVTGGVTTGVCTAASGVSTFGSASVIDARLIGAVTVTDVEPGTN